jgi:hypothetical protein
MKASTDFCADRLALSFWMQNTFRNTVAQYSWQLSRSLCAASCCSELHSRAYLSGTVPAEVGPLCGRDLTHATAIDCQDRICKICVIQYVCERALDFDSHPFRDAEILGKPGI